MPLRSRRAATQISATVCARRPFIRSDREKVGRIGGQAYERESDRQQKLRAFSDHNNPANHFGKRSKEKTEDKIEGRRQLAPSP
jgi:hypothetical protein